MRDYGKVYSRFWSSRDMRGLSEDGRYLALYLMTCQHCTLVGIFQLPDGYVCEDIQWSAERVAKGFAELFRKGFAIRCETTDWVWITKHLEWNGVENPNQAKAAVKIIAEVDQECCWIGDFQKVFADYIEANAKPFRKGSGRVQEGSGKGSPTPAERPGKGSQTVSKPVSVSVSVSEAVTVAVAVPVGRDATGEEAGGEHAAPGGEDSHLNGNEPEPNGHDPDAPDPAEPSGFTLLREIYPARSGSQRWADARKNYLANLKAGYSHQKMLDGVMRYARYCKAEAILGQSIVQQAATFLGDNQGFLEPWKPSEKPKRESPGERWAREEAAKDAAR